MADAATLYLAEWIRRVLSPTSLDCGAREAPCGDDCACLEEAENVLDEIKRLSEQMEP